LRSVHIPAESEPVLSGNRWYSVVLQKQDMIILKHTRFGRILIFYHPESVLS